MDYRYAGFKSRLTGALFDYVIIVIYFVFLTGVFMLFRLKPLQFIPQTLFATPLSGQITVMFMLTLPVILYFSLCESSGYQQTFGKHKAGLKVTGTDGKKLGFPRALLRSVVKFIPWELAHTCIWRIRADGGSSADFVITAGLIFVWLLIIVYIITMVMSKKNQTLYDMIAGSLVIITAGNKTEN